MQEQLDREIHANLPACHMPVCTHLSVNMYAGPSTSLSTRLSMTSYTTLPPKYHDSSTTLSATLPQVASCHIHIRVSNCRFNHITLQFLMVFGVKPLLLRKTFFTLALLLFVLLHACVCPCMHAIVRACVIACVCACICMCVCACVHVRACIQGHVHVHRQT